MAAAIPAIIAAVGTAVTIKANNDANARQRKILNGALDKETEASKKSSQMVIDQAQNLYDPNARKDAIAQQEQQISSQQMQDLQQGAGGAVTGDINTSGDAGNVSEDFIKAKADRAVSEGNRLTSVARDIAKTRSIGGVQQEEAYQNANLAGNLQSLASTNRNNANAAGADAGSVTPSSLGAWGQLASSVGSSAANDAYLKNKYPATAKSGISWNT